MNRLFLRGVLGLLALGVLAGQVAASEAVKLEYKFKPGELMRYKVRQDSTGEMMESYGVDTNALIDGILRLRVSKILPNGDAEIRAAYERGTCSAAGDMANISADYVAPVTFQVSKNGIIRDSKKVFEHAGEITISGDNGNGGKEIVKFRVYGSILTVIFRGTPTRELKVGDTWEPASVGARVLPGAIVHSKLVSTDTQVSGIPVAVVSTTADFKDNPTIGPDDGTPGTQLDVRMTLDSKTSFSVEKGKTVAVDDNLDLNVTSPISNGQTATTKISVQANLIPDNKAR